MLAILLMSALSSGDPVFLYSTRSDNHVRVVNAKDLAPRAEIDVKLGCHELAVSSNNAWAIGSAYGGPGKGHQPADNRLVVINLATNAVHRTIDLGELQRPNDIAFLPKSSEAIVTVEVPPHVVRVNADTGEFTAIKLDHPAGHMLALSPDSSMAYVAHVMPGLVSFVDLAARKTVATVNTPAGAEGIACSPDGKKLWVACNRSNAIVVIDTATREITQRIEAAGFPFRLRFSPDGKTVAVSIPVSGEVGFFDAADPSKLTRVKVVDEEHKKPGAPTSIAFTPDGDSLSVVCDGPAPQLVRVEVAVMKVSERISTALTPDALAAGAQEIRNKGVEIPAAAPKSEGKGA